MKLEGQPTLPSARSAREHAPPLRVLVTGHRGGIGQLLLKELPANVIIRGYDLTDGQDILDRQCLAQAMEGCSQVVHLAAVPRPLINRSLNDYVRVNVMGTAYVAETAIRLGVERLIFTSTIAVHGVESGIPIPRQIDSTTPYLSQRLSPSQFRATRSQVAYATTKAAAEQVLASFGLSGVLDTVILRLGPVDIEHLGFTAFSQRVVRTIITALQDTDRLGFRVITLLDRFPTPQVLHG